MKKRKKNTCVIRTSKYINKKEYNTMRWHIQAVDRKLLMQYSFMPDFWVVVQITIKTYWKLKPNRPSKNRQYH